MVLKAFRVVLVPSSIEDEKGQVPMRLDLYWMLFVVLLSSESVKFKLPYILTANTK